MAVHCAQGRGRAGTMAACALVKLKGLTSSQAINTIRTLRPGSIETEEQEQVIHDYEQHLHSLVEPCDQVTDTKSRSVS